MQGLVKLLGGKNPTLYSYEKSLPYLPVPELEATTKRVSYVKSDFNFNKYLMLTHFDCSQCNCMCVLFQYLESVRPVLSEERFKEMEKLAEDFKV